METLTSEISSNLYKNFIKHGGFVPDEILKAIKIDDFRTEEKTGGSINPNYLAQSKLQLPKLLDNTGTTPNNTKNRFWDATFSVLRSVAKKNIIISSIINTRCQQVRGYSKWTEDEDRPGWKIKLKDGQRKPTKADEKKAKEIAEWVKQTGNRDYEGEEFREDQAEDVFEKIAREQQTIDQIAIEVRYDNRGLPFDYWVLDGSTIKRLRSGGYKHKNNKWTFAQEIDGRVYTLYTHKDLVFEYQNKRSDIMYNGYGYSNIEMSIDIITSFIYGIEYNKAQFNHSSMPKGVLSFEGQNLNKKQMEELQRQWVSMFSGIKGMWKTPILQNKATWQAIAPSNRDLEYNNYIQLLGSFICAVFGIDSAEMGLRFNQAQNVLTENVGSKIAHSKDRGLKQLLSFIQTVINKIIQKNPFWNDFVFCFTGIENKDQLALQELDEKQVKSFKTVNEKRAEKDLQPIEHGDLILDPVYAQALAQAQQAQMAKEEQGEPEGSEGGFDDDDLMSDDDLGDMVGDLGKSQTSKKKSKIKINFEI